MFGLFDISTEALVGYGQVVIVLSIVMLFGLLYVHSLVEGRTQKMLGYLLSAFSLVCILLFLSYFRALLRGACTPEFTSTLMNILIPSVVVWSAFMYQVGRKGI